MKFTAILMILLSGIILTGCSTPSNNSDTYNRSALQSAQRTINGQIVSKRPVTVKGGTGVGSSAGAGIGAIAGSGVGGSASDNAVAAIAGAVIGGTVGAVAENEIFEADAFEYVVDSSVAGLLTIVLTDAQFEVGDEVFIVMGRTPKLIRKSQ